MGKKHMITLSKISLSHDEEAMKQLSSFDTTYFSINPIIDNESLIFKKIEDEQIIIYSINDKDVHVGFFLLQISNYNKALIYVDSLFFQHTDTARCQEYVENCIVTIKSIYNIDGFVKRKELDDRRLIFFEMIGFEKVVTLRKHLFVKGHYQDQPHYYLNGESFLWKKK
ncbi:hypothetical protein [Sporosarcina sp. 6E9]|uniref:hypothetical protein n=1 Tax=Sporosarcina sp. 6E9 TaxID=2819235 RepID=UPI001B304151|nr:hypothetical protein [Sporosarcina sp. 6E9]